MKLKRKDILSTRVPCELKERIDVNAKELMISLSEMTCYYLLKGIECSNCSEELKELAKVHKARLLVTENNNYLYLVQNMVTRVMKFCYSTFYACNGSINMEAVNLIVTGYSQLYDTYPDNIKALIGNDFKKACCNLLDRDYIKERIYSKMDIKPINHIKKEEISFEMKEIEYLNDSVKEDG